MIPKTEIPGVGWFAVFKDPDGTVLAIYRSAPQSDG